MNLIEIVRPNETRKEDVRSIQMKRNENDIGTQMTNKKKQNYRRQLKAKSVKNGKQNYRQNNRLIVRFRSKINKIIDQMNRTHGKVNSENSSSTNDWFSYGSAREYAHTQLMLTLCHRHCEC